MVIKVGVSGSSFAPTPDFRGGGPSGPGIPDFSVGSRGISIFLPRISIPNVVPKLTLPTQAQLTGPAISPEEVQVLATIPIAKKAASSPVISAAQQAAADVRNTARRASKTALGIPLGAEGRAAGSPLWNWVLNRAKTPAELAADLINNKVGGDVALDLGNLLGNVANTFITAKYGTATTPVGYAPTEGLGVGGAGLGVTPVAGIPFVDVIPEAGGGGNMVWNPRANCGAGKWIRRSRRRRKRLASASDIKDLASLKSVMGPSALKTWIATHS